MWNRQLACRGVRPRAIRLAMDVLRGTDHPVTFMSPTRSTREASWNAGVALGYRASPPPRNQGSTVAIHF